MLSLSTCSNKHAQLIVCRQSVSRNTYRVTLVQTLYARTVQGVIIMGVRRSISSILIALYTHRSDTGLICCRLKQTIHTYVRLKWLLLDNSIN